MGRASNKYFLFLTASSLLYNLYPLFNSGMFAVTGYEGRSIDDLRVSLLQGSAVQQSSLFPFNNISYLFSQIWIMPYLGFLFLAAGIAILLFLLRRLKRLNINLKATGEELKERERKWRRAEKIANLGYFEYSSGNKKVFWALPVSNDDEVYQKELTWEEYLDLIVPEDREFLVEKVKNDLAKGQPFDIEYTVNILDKKMNIRAKGEGTVSPDGEIEKIMGTLYNITEPKKIQEKLEQSEERFRLLSNLTFEGIIIYKDGVMIDCNQSFLSLTEYDRNELTGKNVIEILTGPDDREKAEEEVNARKNLLYEVTCITKTGTKIPVEIESREIIYDGGVARVATLRDITKRKEQESNLAYEQWLFNMLMNSIPDSIYFKDVDSRFTRVNKAMLEKHGLKSPSEIVGKTDFDLFDIGHAQPAFDDEQQIIKTRIPIIRKIEKEVWGDGHESWVLTTKLPYYDQNGNLKGTYGISRNITDLKNTQEKLQEEKEKFERLYRIVPSAIFTVDIDSNITSWNSMAEELTGFMSSEVVGKRCDQIIKGSCSKSCGLFGEDIKKPVINSECSLRRKDGKYITISKNVDCIKDANGNIIGGIESFIDISQRKEYENEIKRYSEELKESNMSKDKFFSIIAHDLRNPFITLLGFTEMMIEDYEDFSDEEKMVYLKEMEKTSRSSYELLDNLLQWSRSQTGRIKFDPQKINFNMLLGKNIDLVCKNSEMKNISIKVETEDHLYVFADEDMLTTVVRNLLTNALKFTERGGEIKVGAKDEGDHYRMFVSDNGTGMSQEKVDDLFRMDSVHSTDGTEGEKGSGLGLVLCKEFIEKHNCKIWIESEEGKGTTFYFTIPKRINDNS